jgi:hypothetical protein
MFSSCVELNCFHIEGYRHVHRIKSNYETRRQRDIRTEKQSEKRDIRTEKQSEKRDREKER